MKIFSALQAQYDAFINQVRGYLSKTLSNVDTSFGSNTIFGQIITVVANAMQNIMLYIEDALVEQNKYTAQRARSIWGLATLSGYSPSLGKASVVSLKLTHTPHNVVDSNLMLNNKDVLICTQNGLKYNIILPQETIILNATRDNSDRYFSAVQGTFTSQRFVSNGGKYYTINFKFNNNLDTDYLTVTVNNEIWECAGSFYDMSPDAKQYTYKAAINGGIDLIFGNGAHGRPLEANDVVIVEYLIHSGETGNLDPNIETFFVFDKTMLDTNGEAYDGNAMFNITFANTDPVASGSNAESIEHMRQMIGLNSRSLVLASPDNYKVLINRFGFCGYNSTWVDANSMVVNSLIVKNFKVNLKTGQDYFKLTENDFILSDLQKNSIYKYIESTGGQLAATKYNIFDPNLCKYAMFIYVSLKSAKYNKDSVAEQIKHVVGEFFMNLQSDMFIPKSDIIHVIKGSVAGIDGVDIYFISQKNEAAMAKGEYTEEYYEMNNLTGQYIKKTENIKLYDGENPNIGLDIHGNIYLKHDSDFPVLMGGWDCKDSDGKELTIDTPITIIFED